MTTRRETQPHPRTLSHLRATNVSGCLFACGTAIATALAIWLSLWDAAIAWITGQLLLAAALVEWFAILHECGHNTLFPVRWANVLVGHIAGAFALIPFPIWRRIHGRHHKWTGWQDLDPTTAALVPRERAAWERAIVNICWKYWIPLFSVIYRASNFWHLARLRRMFPDAGVRRSILGSATGLAAIYVAIVSLVGPLLLVRTAGLALVLALIVEDLLIISQHTHVPMARSDGREVAPYPALDQERFTRSLRLPACLSRAALHIDAHELHHMYPWIPGYRLREVGYATANEVSWTAWVRSARAIKGETLLFENRGTTGFDL